MIYVCLIYLLSCPSYFGGWIVLRVESRALHMLVKCSTIELHPSPSWLFFIPFFFSLLPTFEMWNCSSHWPFNSLCMCSCGWCWTPDSPPCTDVCQNVPFHDILQVKLKCHTCQASVLPAELHLLPPYPLWLNDRIFTCIISCVTLDLTWQGDKGMKKG